MGSNRLGTFVQIALAGVLLVMAASPATATIQSQSANKCIEDPDTTSSDLADLEATVHRVEGESNQIQVRYYTEHYSGELKVNIQQDSEIINSTGFQQPDSGSYYVWTGQNQPTITYRIETLGTQYNSGEDFVFAPPPRHQDAAVNVQPAEAGVIGDTYMMLGNHTVHERSFGCHTVRLVTSTSANPKTNPEKTFSSLAYAAEEMSIGHRYDQVTIFSVPENRDTSHDGRAMDNEGWVSAQANPSTAQNPYVHEYIHTRQNFGSADAKSGWFQEGSATYLTMKLMKESGYVTPMQYNREMEIMLEEESGVLSNVTTWRSSQFEYHKGAIVLAALDSRLSESNETNATVESIHRDLNMVDGSDRTNLLLQQSDLLSAVNESSPEHIQRWFVQQIENEPSVNSERVLTEEPPFWERESYSDLVATAFLGLILLISGYTLVTDREDE